MERMGKNKPISFESIEKICAALNCNVGDIIDVTFTAPTLQNNLALLSCLRVRAGLRLELKNPGLTHLGLLKSTKTRPIR